jgi:hypothetical protein
MAKSNQNAAPTETSAPAPTPAKFVPKVIKQVSTNLLKLKPGMTVYVKVTDAMKKAPALKKQQTLPDGEKPKEPPTLLPCINLETGEVATIIAGSVLVDLFNDEYPNGSYVGKGFAIEVKDQKASAGGGGRRYNNYNVAEIEVPK